MKLKNFDMISEDKFTEIFCIADDFNKVFDAQMEKYMFKAERKRKYHCESRIDVRIRQTASQEEGYNRDSE